MSAHDDVAEDLNGIILAHRFSRRLLPSASTDTRCQGTAESIAEVFTPAQIALMLAVLVDRLCLAGPT